MSEGNGKRGRPKGSKNGARLTKWVPKEWTVAYEKMVLLDCAGWTNTQIADELKCTPQHVSNVLNTPHAALTRRAVLDRLHEKALKSIPDRLNAIAVKTVERMQTAIEDDELFANSPFAVIDRGIKVLQGTGHLSDPKKDKGGSINVEKAIILSGDHSKELLDGLREAEEVKQLYSGEDGT